MAAPTNHARIGEAITILSEELGPWITQVLKGRVPEEASWPQLLEAKDGYPSGQRYSAGDLQCQLRIITERIGSLGFLFNGVLSRGEQNLAGELREVRNAWAHTSQFNADDAYRALDTAERLLKAINVPRAAARIRRIRLDIQRSTYEAAARRDTRAAAVAMPGFGENGLTSWRDVVRPHPDIVSGDFGQAEFAADLHQVAEGEGADEYASPFRFYERTYLTEGLKTLLRMSARRLGGDRNAQAVINLQTTFGGGKTHSMLAIWHLAGGLSLEELPQDVQDLLENRPLPGSINRVAIVGSEIAPGQPTVKPDGTVVNTLWGELAWQLGGADAYAIIADADRTGTNPGRALRTLLSEYAPALILIDEWVAYARGLYGRDDLVGGSFDTQFTFAQELTAAVQGVPGALLLVSIPASDIRPDGSMTRASELEIGGEGGREALQRLQHVVARVAHNWSPATSGESFEIVRRRLFADLDAEATRRRDATVKSFAAYYRSQRGELPRETCESEYENRLRAAYPIHPELFDRLYGDWSSLERFQRTRGVLRLMSAVVHSLVQAGDDSPLIMPGSIPFDDAAVRDEIAGYLDDSWRTIIERDVDGERATPLQVDRDRPIFGRRALTRRIARALFLGSAATLDSAHKGIERDRLFLGVAMPGDTLGNFGSSLQLLTDRATYVYNEGTRSWYDRQPSINRIVVDRAAALEGEDVAEAGVEMLRALAGTAPEFSAVDIAPTSTGDVPDSPSARLALLHPRHTVGGRASDPTGPGMEFAHELLRLRGSAPRVNTNALILVAPDKERWNSADHALRLHLAWSEMVRPDSIREHDLTQSQKEQARRKAQEAYAAAERAVSAAWMWALYPVQSDGSRPFSVGCTRVDGSDPKRPIAMRAGVRLGKEDIILTEATATTIALQLNSPNLRAKWNEGRIAAAELWDIFTHYPYMPRLRDERVFLDALTGVMNDLGWDSMGFALASGYDSEHGDFMDLRIPLEDEAPPITLETLLVAPALARAQRKREETVRMADPSEQGEVDAREAITTVGNRTGGVQFAESGGSRRARPDAGRVGVENARFEGSTELDPTGDIAAQFTALAEEILVHLQRGGADSLEIAVSIDAIRREGFDRDIVRTITENARVLGLKPGRFVEG
jgi:hypothetical protein avisC_05697